MVILVTTRTLQASSAMLLSSWRATSMYGWNCFSRNVGLCTSGTSRCSCQPIFSRLLRTLWIPTQSSYIPNSTPSFVPSSNLLRVHLPPTFCSLIKKLILLCLAYNTNDWPLCAICATDFNALSLTIQPIFNPTCFTLIEPIFH